MEVEPVQEITLRQIREKQLREAQPLCKKIKISRFILCPYGPVHLIGKHWKKSPDEGPAR